MCRYFNDTLSILCEFIPQLIFLLGIFGYLIILIVYKWLAIDSTEAACAPSLLIGKRSSRTAHQWAWSGGGAAGTQALINRKIIAY